MTVPSYIYLIEAENGLVKIGHAISVLNRAAAVRTHSPLRTRLIAWWPGEVADEMALHDQFSGFRQHGEWFRAGGAFGEFVAEKRGLNVPDIPEWDDLLFINREEFTRRRYAALRGKGGLYRERRKAQSPVSKGCGLTRKQGEALRFIREYIRTHHGSPSYEEMRREFGLSSKSGVHRLIHALVERGRIAVDHNRARSLRVIEAQTERRKPAAPAVLPLFFSAGLH